MPDIATRTVIAGLSQVEDRIASLLVPDEPFDSKAAWSQTYTVLAVENGAAVGRVKVSRKREGANNTLLLVDWKKGAGAGAHWRVSTTIRGANEVLGSVLSWTSGGSRHEGFFDGDPKPVETSRVFRSGERSEKKLTIASGAQRSSQFFDVAGPTLIHWQLFDVVQRLERRLGERHEFTLIDHLDQVKPRQVLSYRGVVETSIGSRQRKLHGFNLVGFATVPWVYWIDDETGRLVAATSGLEAYVLGELPRGGGRAPAQKAKKKAKNAE